jgi:hypothetical protein
VSAIADTGLVGGRPGLKNEGQMSSRWRRRPEDDIPDVRDGLTRLERIILTELRRAQREERSVATALLYGRVVEHIDISVPEFQRVLRRLIGR